MRRKKEELNIRCVLHWSIPISALFGQPFFLGCLDSAVGRSDGGVAEVVSSNPTVGHRNIFQPLPA